MVRVRKIIHIEIIFPESSNVFVHVGAGRGGEGDRDRVCVGGHGGQHLGQIGDIVEHDPIGDHAGVFELLERTLLTLDRISDPALRRRSSAGLNKGEAHHALKRAVFFHRLGEIRDRTFENQSYRASGLNLAVAAIILWNIVYLGRVVDELCAGGEAIVDELLAHAAPLGWEHIAFNGDYVWPAEPLEAGFRPLQKPHADFLSAA